MAGPRPWGSAFQSTLSVRRATCRRGELVTSDIFQSTLSVRRATITRFWNGSRFQISIHALREESDWYRADSRQPRRISIHALREESDQPALASTSKHD